MFLYSTDWSYLLSLNDNLWFSMSHQEVGQCWKWAINFCVVSFSVLKGFPKNRALLHRSSGFQYYLTIQQKAMPTFVLHCYPTKLSVKYTTTTKQDGVALLFAEHPPANSNTRHSRLVHQDSNLCLACTACFSGPVKPP